MECLCRNTILFALNMNVANEKDLKMTNDKKNYGNAIAHEPTMSKPNETVDGNESIECRYGWIVVGASFTIHMIGESLEWPVNME